MFDGPALETAFEDSQRSLAAALARIEALRIKERHLIDELAQLRQQVHGQQISQTKAAVKAITDAAAAASSATQAAVSANAPSSGGIVLIPSRSHSKELRASSTCSLTIPQPKETAFTAFGNDTPLYVTSLTNDNHPVAVWLPGKTGLERVNCQLVIDRDRIDFVELRVRVRSEDFIGITAIKETKKAADADKGGAQGAGDTVASTDMTEGKARYRIYLRGREQKPVEFDASQTTRATLHKHTQRWLGQDDETTDETALKEAAAAEAGHLVAPRHLVAGLHTMRLVGDPSHILTPDHVSALASAVPALERMRDWGLSYSTKVHGISLSTLYRKVQTGLVPSLTVIKDNAAHVFGCYTPESWKISPRYYGSGETFVFQLEPHRVMWPWQSLSKEKNDFFQYSTPGCLALGGTGHFALHVDQELLQGSSGMCGTFGSPSLSGREDFKVMCLEVWQVVN